MQTDPLIGKQYIDGHFILGQGKAFSSINPVNNKVIWEGHYATTPEVHAAVHAARHALVRWSALDLDQRIAHLKAFEAYLKRNLECLAEIISLETGKPNWEAKTEAEACVQKVAISIEAYHTRTLEQVNTDTALRYKPHGVAAVIGPFNFPAHLSNGHIVPLLLAGNAIVYKPSSQTPYVAEFMVGAWHESGLPPGVLNLVQGSAETANALIESEINALCFTGSYQTGVQINEKLASRPEVITALEMGGNNPLVIDESIKDTKAAIYHTLLSAFITAGQRCTCARRVMIPKSNTGELFLEHLIKASKALAIGAPGDNPAPFMGPVIHPNQALSELNAANQLVSIGGEALLDMSLIKPESAFLSPGIILMDDAKEAFDEEIFAPLIQVYTYSDFDEAITLANHTKYGLAAGLIGGDETRFKYFYQRINAGLINWNRPTTGASSTLPFGGVGCSGNHRPSAYFAADYAAIPVASLEDTQLTMPNTILPGIHLEELPS